MALATPPELFLALSPDERWVLDTLGALVPLPTPDDTLRFAVWLAASQWKIAVPPRAFSVRGAGTAPPSSPDVEPPSICGCGYEGTAAELIIHVLVGECHEAVELKRQLKEDHGVQATVTPL